MLSLQIPASTSLGEGLGDLAIPSNEATTQSLTHSTDTTSASTAAALIGWTTATALEEKKKRKALHRASRDEEPPLTRQEKELAKQRKELQKIWDANGAAIYEANREYKTKHGKEMDAAARSKAIKDATRDGVFNAGAYASNTEEAVEVAVEEVTGATARSGVGKLFKAVSPGWFDAVALTVATFSLSAPLWVTIGATIVVGAALDIGLESLGWKEPIKGWINQQWDTTEKWWKNTFKSSPPSYAQPAIPAPTSPASTLAPTATPSPPASEIPTATPKP